MLDSIKFLLAIPLLFPILPMLEANCLLVYSDTRKTAWFKKRRQLGVELASPKRTSVILVLFAAIWIFIHNIFRLAAYPDASLTTPVIYQLVDQPFTQSFDEYLVRFTLVALLFQAGIGAIALVVVSAISIKKTRPLSAGWTLPWIGIVAYVVWTIAEPLAK